MIRIANWLLTRKCNLSCDYCAIVKNYKDMPDEYPPMKHYIQNEMPTQYVVSGLKRLKLHNPDMFHIFYGGEPMLRKDLGDIISYCHQENIHYTIISNNTKEVQPLVKKLIDRVGKIKGYTASIDPILVRKNIAFSDRFRKTREGYHFLKWMTNHCDDVVAEITVMKDDVNDIYTLVKYLSENGINSDITFIDTSKTPYYDFSNISDPNLLVRQTAQLAEEFKKLHEDKSLDIHMKDVLLKGMWDTLPSNMDCEIDKDLHNISIDADGTIRLCLRIRGVSTPSLIKLEHLITFDNKVSPVAQAAIKKDKKRFCKLCNHTCQLMSKHINDKDTGPDDLVHLDRR